MKHRVIKFIVGLTILGVCVFVGAQGTSIQIPPSSTGLSTQQANACGISGIYCVGVNIDEFWIHSSGTLFIDTSGDENMLSCAAFGGKYLQLEKSHANYKEFYTTLIAAQLSDKAILVEAANVVSSPYGACEINSVVLYR